MIEIGSNIASIAVQIQKRSRLRSVGRNPPTCKLIAPQRKSDIFKWHARVSRSCIDVVSGMVEDLRLRVPNCPGKEKVANCGSGKQCPD